MIQAPIMSEPVTLLSQESYFCFSNLAEFPMMPISGRDCAAAARTGGRKPNAARVKPTTLYRVVNARFVLMIRIVRLAIFMAVLVGILNTV